LGERGVFRVDRDEPLRLALDQVDDEVATDDQALLVGEGEQLARLKGRERGPRRP
jgi:hypothetical protein